MSVSNEICNNLSVSVNRLFNIEATISLAISIVALFCYTQWYRTKLAGSAGYIYVLLICLCVVYCFFYVAIFWDIAPCSPYVNRCFRGTYHLHLQGRKSAEKGFRPWRWRRYIPPKCRFTYRLHGAIFQKMATFITTAVGTSNPAYFLFIFICLAVLIL
jgi:hypothetical protein